MNFKKGQFVTVTDFMHRQIRCRVWDDDGGAAICVASEEIYPELEAGQIDAFPARFPREDVTPAVPEADPATPVLRAGRGTAPRGAGASTRKTPATPRRSPAPVA